MSKFFNGGSVGLVLLSAPGKGDDNPVGDPRETLGILLSSHDTVTEAFLALRGNSDGLGVAREG